MSATINTNLASLGAQRHGSRTQNDVATAIARLSSGLRINSARDDAAGLAIAGRFTAQLRGTGQAARNANDAISLAQTADGALASVGANLQRIRELSVQAANGTGSASDRASLQREVAELVAENERIAAQTQFNGINLLDGSFTARAFQVGAESGQTVSIDSIPSMRSATLGMYRGFAYHGLGFPPDNLPQPRSVAVGAAAPVVTGMFTSDARQIVESVNRANVPGLRATASPTRVNGVASSASAGSAGTATYTINGVAIAIGGVIGAGALAANRTAAAAAINARSADTGVTATDNGSAVGLVAADGRNIMLGYAAGTFSGSTAAEFGLSSSAITGGRVNYDYRQPPGVVGDIVLTHGATIVSYAVSPMGNGVASLDVSTSAAAVEALDTVDSALATVNSARAGLGAVQNRFASMLENLASHSESLLAARGRIQDADFAAETANLSRTQVMQQAAAAMLAQANLAPRRVVDLLR